MAKDLRMAFFSRIRAQQDAIEKARIPSPGFENVPRPERLWDYLDYVGCFLLETGVITLQDRDLAVGMIEDYEDRFDSIFPDLE